MGSVTNSSRFVSIVRSQDESARDICNQIPPSDRNRLLHHCIQRHRTQTIILHHRICLEQTTMHHFPPSTNDVEWDFQRRPDLTHMKFTHERPSNRPCRKSSIH